MQRSPEQSHIISIFGNNRENQAEDNSKSAEAERRLEEKENKAQQLAVEIRDLRLQANSTEDYELIIQKAQALERLVAGGESMEQQEAREILGENFFGKDQIREAFGFEIEDANIPELSYSREDLEKAKELGEMLVLRMDKDYKGNPLTMMKLVELTQSTYDTKGYGKVLYSADFDSQTGKAIQKSDSWYKDEEFAHKDTPKLEWKLISKEVIPESTSKNYIEQTRTLRDYLKEHDLITEEELAECSDERLQQITDFMNANYEQNWKEVANQLAELGVNKNHRRIPVESLYDSLLVMGSKGERLLEKLYEWTARRSSDGYLVDFGDADASGAGVRRNEPGGSRGGIGVVSSR